MAFGKEFDPADVIKVDVGDHDPLHLGGVNSDPRQNT